jgi:hypothetical protein
MAFTPLMSKDTILQHIDHEIVYRETLLSDPGQELMVEAEFLDKETFDMPVIDLLWKPLNQIYLEVEKVRIKQLKQWRKEIVEELEEK